MADASRDAQKESALAILTEACERNMPVELHYMDGGGELTVAKARLIYADSECLYLDQPQRLGGQVTFRAGQQIDAFLSFQDSLFTFSALVISGQTMVAINQRKKVTGRAITRSCV